MSSLRNRVHLIGNVGGDPEVKSFDNNRKLVRFSLATNENYRNGNGEKITDTQWHQIVAWNKTAELAEKLITKGRELAVEGKLVTRNYEDSKGEKRYATEVVINEFVLTGSKPAE